MRLFSVILFAGVLTFATSGCVSKASDEDCKAACDNLATVALGEVDEAMQKDPDAAKAGAEGQKLVKRVAVGMLDEIQGQCMEQCKQKAPEEQAKCMAAAKTVKELVACK